MAPPTPTVVDLRARPELCATVADRVWRAWWRPNGHALAPIGLFVRTCLGDGAVPSAVAALDGGAYAGSALVIAADCEARPQYAPWVAAVWVEPGHRRRGVGAALVGAGLALARRGGADPVYLCAMPHNHAFYGRLGWTMIEADVDGEGLAVFRSP